MNGYTNFNNSWNQGRYNTSAPPRNTNVVLVTGPDEAVMRTPNDADMLYIDQSRPVMYRVVADMWGRKSLAEYPYVVPTVDNSAPVTRAEFDSLVAKVTSLMPKEVSEDAQPVQ